MRTLFCAVLLTCGCAASFSSMQSLGSLSGLVIEGALSAAVAAADNGRPPKDGSPDERDVPIAKLMERSRLQIATERDFPVPAHCHASVQATGARTWRVDSCDEHLRCSATHASNFTCVVPADAQE